MLGGGSVGLEAMGGGGDWMMIEGFKLVCLMGSWGGTYRGQIDT